MSGLVPFGGSGGFDAQNFAAQLAFSQMQNDGTQQMLGGVLGGNMAGHVVGKLATAQQDISESMARTLERLERLGYDKDSDAAKNLIESNTKMQSVLGDLGERIGQRI